MDIQTTIDELIAFRTLIEGCPANCDACSNFSECSDRFSNEGVVAIIDSAIEKLKEKME